MSFSCQPSKQYLQWAEIWTTPDHETPKFTIYARNHPDAARRVIDQLGVLSETLFSAKELQNYRSKAKKGNNPANAV